MNYFKTMFEPFKEEKIVKTISLIGILGALSIALSFTATISLGPYLKIGFGSLANRIVDFIFGPIVGGIFGGVMDIIKFVLNPSGPFHFGFTLNAILGSVLFGSVVYNKKLTIHRILIANVLVKGIVNIGLNTLWLSQISGKGIYAIIAPRIASNFVMIGVDTAIYFSIFKIIKVLVDNYYKSTNKSNLTV
ncbi:folate family ECF transporter S component [Lachnobacterium bovis]|uniref:ECF transporter S component, folate family n=1 Tax=Lachnobacterium bovis TaxID=140626 RepID=A0A1H9SZ42_9FIRM|nr:folate family ECF transporter S component [Lachnobacterium bovis]SER90064.1 ECF transporter S component, folate family [Lachnobacterium bovis]